VRQGEVRGGIKILQKVGFAQTRSSRSGIISRQERFQALGGEDRSSVGRSNLLIRGRIERRGRVVVSTIPPQREFCRKKGFAARTSSWKGGKKKNANVRTDRVLPILQGVSQTGKNHPIWCGNARAASEEIGNGSGSRGKLGVSRSLKGSATEPT